MHLTLDFNNCYESFQYSTVGFNAPSCWRAVTSIKRWLRARSCHSRRCETSFRARPFLSAAGTRETRRHAGRATPTRSPRVCIAGITQYSKTFVPADRGESVFSNTLKARLSTSLSVICCPSNKYSKRNTSAWVSVTLSALSPKFWSTCAPTRNSSSLSSFSLG